MGHRPGPKGGYFPVNPVDSAQDLRGEMLAVMGELGMKPEKHHHEVAPAQHELGLKFDTMVTMADRLQLYKYVIQNVAHAYGKTATFMAKPMFADNGSGMHVHQSIWGGGKPMFAGDKYAGLSQTCLWYIGGIIKHAKAINAFSNSTTNSYKRLVPGYEAPVYVGWARVNRSALIRVPQISPGQPESTRIELRCPDASCNPYLAFSVMLACGLDGVRNEMEPPAPVEENLYHFDEFQRAQRNVGMLPSSLGEALDELERDDVVRHALGDHVYDRFIEAKRAEWSEYRIQISPWELERYLPIF
jgi:glutamine synthetase